MSTIDVLRVVLSLFVLVAGVMHFVTPRTFDKMMPPYVPAHRALVLVSGACEIGLAVALLVPQSRFVAAVGLIALFVAVFPANLHMALNGISFGTKPTPAWVLWARLPLQLVFIAWAWLVR